MTPEQFKRLSDENRELKARVAELEALVQPGTTSSGLIRRETILGLAAMVMVVGADSTVQYINTPMTQLLAQGREHLMGQPLTSVDHFPWGAGVLTILLEKSRKENQPQEIEAHYISPRDQHVRHVIIRGTPANGGIQFVIEDRTRYKHLEMMFNRYVAPNIISRMMKTGKDYLSAESAEVTVLFSDLRGFTAASRNLSPERVKELIDTHLEAMIDVIINHDGTVNDIMGDGLMAVFGAPVHFADHAVKAINAAITMQRAHREVIERWSSRGLPALPLGIGMNSGDVVVGNIGCERRMEYTALGYTVNVAARLCQAAAGGDVIVSTYTFQMIRSLLEAGGTSLTYPVRFRNGVQVHAKGIDEPVLSVVAFEANG